MVTPDADPMTLLFRAFAAVAQAESEAREKARAARRIELHPARSSAARQGWETRRAREAAERATEAVKDAVWREQQDRIGVGPWCDEMDLNGIGREVFCILRPGHDDDHEDVDGHAWTNDEQVYDVAGRA